MVLPTKICIFASNFINLLRRGLHVHCAPATWHIIDVFSPFISHVFFLWKEREKPPI